MASIFDNAQTTTIGANATILAAARDINTTNNYNNTGSGDRVTLYGRTIRKVIDGDIILRHQQSSQVLSVNVNSQRGVPTCSGSRVVKAKQAITRRRRLWSQFLSIIVKPQGGTSTSRSSTGSSQVVKVKRTQQSAEIYGYSGAFTVITLEPVDENDRDKFEEASIAKSCLEAVMRWRSALLVQVFAVAESSALTLIVHDELANGDEFTDLYWEKEMIVYYYVEYTRSLAIQSLHNDRTMRFPVTTRFEDWSFNLKTLSWHYDLAALSLNPPHEKDLQLIFNPLPPLRQETLPHLNTPEIRAYIEEALGDVLYLVASFASRWMIDLSHYARHGLLTFGAVIDLNKSRILAHHSSTPSPEWFCRSRNPDVKATLSSSGRVDLAFHKTADVEVNLEFGLRIPVNHCNQLHCAYLSQSLRLCYESDDVRCVVYIDQVGFNLKGTFVNHPTTCNLPAYLFVPPLHTEVINNLYCIRHPLPQSRFYWAHDPQGRSVIAKEDWKKFGIPELRVEELIGSWWKKSEYRMVRDHLRHKDYDLDGREYARDHGYPELIFADPHDTARIEELKA
ncbi:hypothetical protein PQX77_002084 [Marasmius sp. AFHP31]|nr:hypothetical protein PQX77_002084 [Marasmius sp. AFHP31]